MIFNSKSISVLNTTFIIQSKIHLLLQFQAAMSSASSSHAVTEEKVTAGQVYLSSLLAPYSELN